MLSSPSATELARCTTYAYASLGMQKSGASAGVNAPEGNDSADGAPEIAAAMGAGEYPEHVVDQREIYEAYGFLDMPHAQGQYTAQPERVQELTYSP